MGDLRCAWRYPLFEQLGHEEGLFDFPLISLSVIRFSTIFNLTG